MQVTEAMINVIRAFVPAPCSREDAYRAAEGVLALAQPFVYLDRQCGFAYPDRRCGAEGPDDARCEHEPDHVGAHVAVTHGLQTW